MAKIYPTVETGAASLEEFSGGRSEMEVYEAIRDGLSDEYTAFYGVSWITTGGEGPSRDGETDFVLIHPKKGILILEVKGGQIHFDGLERHWTSTNKSGEKISIKDPFKQALKSKYALLDKLKNANSTIRYPLAHAVCFPGAREIKGKLPASMDEHLIITRSDFKELDKKLDSIFLLLNEKVDSKFTELSVDILKKLIGSSFSLSDRLASSIQSGEDSLLRLTDAQLMTLRALSGNRRMGIQGGAGTGKTVLALEKAKSLAQSGKKTLLTCFNRPLAARLSQKLGDVPNLTVQNFHSICENWLKVASPDHHQRFKSELVKLYEGKDSEFLIKQRDRLWSETLIEMMMDASELYPNSERFDAVVIDEAQDLLEPWWLIIDEILLQKSSKSHLYFFFDPNQKIYGGKIPESLEQNIFQFKLFENYRNTQEIFSVLERFFNDQTGEYLPKGGHGPHTEAFKLAENENLTSSLSKLLNKMVVNDGIKPNQIAVLSCATKEPMLELKKQLADQSKASFTDDFIKSQNPKDQLILVDSVRRFKGLEKPVVILTGLNHVAQINESNPELAEHLLYVGISRATQLLIAMGTDAEIWKLKIFSKKEKAGRLKSVVG